ncbi:MAG: 4Fe-4S dicluster domain-containing protein [Bacteroidota bacterium]
MSIDRRDFFKAIGLVGITLTLGKELRAAPIKKDETEIEFSGILIDTTKCVGCRTCEHVCAEANGLSDSGDDETGSDRRTSEKRNTVINTFNIDGNEIYVKKQCMHCNQPACATGCLTKAMKKTDEGPVIWRGNKCMGCRFCMVNCPFGIPIFDYSSPNPKIQKCQMCFERLQEGKKPACVENCPGEAIIFGKRRDLIEIAKARIYAKPKRYIHRIYGENEVGGTGVLYLASVPFEKLGFKNNLGETPYPEYSKGFLYSVPVIFTVLPALLLGLHSAAKYRIEKNEKEESYE